MSAEEAAFAQMPREDKMRAFVLYVQLKDNEASLHAQMPEYDVQEVIYAGKRLLEALQRVQREPNSEWRYKVMRELAQTELQAWYAELFVMNCDEFST